MKKETAYFGNPAAGHIFIQPVDDHDLEEMQSETENLAKLAGNHDWCILTVKVKDWNRELTPWKSDPVFGNEGFGDGAQETLNFITEDLLPELEREHPGSEKRFFLGGYSLAGFFSLWAAYQTDLFAGVAAVSPSVWYPGWIRYAQGHTPLAPAIYLSLGDREERTRNRTMAAVGDAIRQQQKLLADADIRCTLEWNKGNHFAGNGLRMAKGFAWLIKHQ